MANVCPLFVHCFNTVCPLYLTLLPLLLPSQTCYSWAGDPVQHSALPCASPPVSLCTTSAVQPARAPTVSLPCAPAVQFQFIILLSTFLFPIAPAVPYRPTPADQPPTPFHALSRLSCTLGRLAQWRRGAGPARQQCSPAVLCPSLLFASFPPVCLRPFPPSPRPFRASSRVRGSLTGLLFTPAGWRWLAQVRRGPTQLARADAGRRRGLAAWANADGQGTCCYVPTHPLQLRPRAHQLAAHV